MNAPTRTCTFCQTVIADVTHTTCTGCGAPLAGLAPHLVRGPTPEDAPPPPREIPLGFAVRHLLGTWPYWLTGTAISLAVGIVMVGWLRVWPSLIVPVGWSAICAWFGVLRLVELYAMRYGVSARAIVLFASRSPYGWNNTQVRYVFFGPERTEGETITSDPSTKRLRTGDPIAIVHLPGLKYPAYGPITAPWPPLRGASWP